MQKIFSYTKYIPNFYNSFKNFHFLSRTNQFIMNKTGIYFELKKYSITKSPDFSYKYNSEVENKINEQIHYELQASYVYLMISSHCASTRNALLGYAGYFLKMSDEEREHAKLLIRFQNKRGGSFVSCQINETPKINFTNIIDVLKLSLELENSITDKLIDVHNIAHKHCDICTVDFIITQFINEQITSIREIGLMLSEIEFICDPKTAIKLMDLELRQKYPYM